MDRRDAEKLHGLVSDGGGEPMIRADIKVHLARAQIQNLHSRRALREARGGVLEAQRQAEWASQERQEQTEYLREAKSNYEKSKDDVAKWRLKSARKLKKMRSDAAISARSASEPRGISTRLSAVFVERRPS